METGLSETPDDVAVAAKRPLWVALAARLGQGLRLFGIALTDFARNNCHYVAAGIAYWTVLSLFPLALAGVSILGYLYPDSADQQEIVHRIIGLIPVSAEYLTELVNEVADARGTLGLLAVGGLLFTGTAMFSAVRKGINHAWHIGEPQYFVVERLIDLLMLLGVALLAAFTVVFATGVAGLASVFRAPDWLIVSVAARSALEAGALAVSWGILVVMYRYIPNTKVRWRDVIVGAFVGALAYQLVRIGFAWLVSGMSGFNLVYGSLGSLVAVLVWAYMSAMAVLWGAQVSFTCRQASMGLLPAQAAGEGRARAPMPSTPLGLIKMVLSWLLPPSRRRP